MAHRRTRSGTMDSPPNGIDRSDMETEVIAKLRKKSASKKKDKSATVDGSGSKKDKKKEKKEASGGSWSEDMQAHRRSAKKDGDDNSDSDNKKDKKSKKKEKDKLKPEVPVKSGRPNSKSLLAASSTTKPSSKHQTLTPETRRSASNLNDNSAINPKSSADDIDLGRLQLSAKKSGSLSEQSSPNVQLRTAQGRKYPHSDYGATASRHMEAVPPSRSSHLAVDDKSDKLSRWGSLRGIRDGLKRELRMGEEEITHNPLVALQERKVQAQHKDHARAIALEREVLSESPELDPTTLKRHKCINEIVNTERDYINDLNVIIKLIYEPMLRDGILSAEESKDIFSNVKSLVGVNNQLYSELWTKAKETDGNDLGQIFSDLSNYLKLYSQYCGNQRIAREAIANSMKTNHRFKAFVEKHMQAPEYGGLSLKDYLIKPVQRLCKYPLLLRELLRYTEESHPDYAKLNKAFDNISDVVLSVNAQKQQEEEMEEVAHIMQDKLEGTEKFKVPLMTHGRKFVKEGTLTLASQDHTSTSSSYYFLFSDLLVLAKAPEVQEPVADAKRKTKKPNKGPKYEVTAMLPFAMCLLAEVPDDETNQLANIVEIIYATTVHTFVFEKAWDKLEWIKSLKNIEKTENPSSSPAPTAAST